MLRRARRRALASAIAGALVPAGASGAAPVETVDAVVYGRAPVRAPAAGSAPLLLDLYSPAGRSRTPRPVVVVIHGGGFIQQSRKDEGIVRIARGLARRGIVAAAIDYRLLGSQPMTSRRVAPLRAALPPTPLFGAVAAAVDDTLTAVRYLARHARRLGVDVGRLGLVGSSAGAITADHVAYALDDHGIDGPPVRFVGSLWGGILVPPPAGGGASGASQLDRGEAALFAVHGDADRTVPVALSDQLAARARALGVRTVYHRIPGGTHGYPGVGFFTRRVLGSQTAFDRLLVFAQSALRRSPPRSAGLSPPPR